MYTNKITVDPDDSQYVLVRLHRQQLIDINKSLFALKQRKVDNPESTRQGEPLTDTLNELGMVISEAYQLRGDS